MEEFLHQCRCHLEGINENDTLCVVLGNEACDLDSAISALVYAYFLSKSKKYSTINLPVLNIARNDFPLKTEVVFFLKKFNINTDHLIFRNEINLNSLKAKNQLNLVLVDHNVLAAKDSALDESVKEILDHHSVEHSQHNIDFTVEPVGSCCTLVAYKILMEIPELLDPMTATLLYGTIQLDTVNFSATAGRTSSKDLEVAAKLLQIIPKLSIDELYKELQSAKENVSGLNMEELLRKDVKILVSENINVAVCSLPMLCSKFLNSHTDAMATFCHLSMVRNYQAIVLVGIGIDLDTAEIRRDVTVYSSTSPLKDKLCQALEDHVEPSLNLTVIQSNTDWTHYNQGNVTASRKIILPILKDALAQEMNPGSPGTKNPNGIHPAIRVRASQVLSVAGDPVSVEGSSHSSSTYSSCPYTPSNSCVDDGEAQTCGEDLSLPVFNSRDVVDKIESKRVLFSNNHEIEDDALPSCPYTPKNSFVENSFEQAYQKFVLDHMNTVTLIDKLQQENFFHEEDGNQLLKCGDKNQE